MANESGVAQGERPWHPESPHGVTIHIEEERLLVARRVTNTMHDTADLGQVLTIDLNYAGDIACAALLSFCSCRQSVTRPKKSTSKKRPSKRK